jgi:hypothetical protein
VTRRSSPAKPDRDKPKRRPVRNPQLTRSFRGFVPKTRQALTFSATISADVNVMQTITVITILALMTISGAAISDRILTSQERATMVVN